MTSPLRKYRVVLEVVVNVQATEVPGNWNWNSLLDVRGDESVALLECDTGVPVQPDEEQQE